MANQTIYPVVIATVKGVTLRIKWLPLFFGADFQVLLAVNETNHARSHGGARLFLKREKVHTLDFIRKQSEKKSNFRSVQF